MAEKLRAKLLLLIEIFISELSLGHTITFQYALTSISLSVDEINVQLLIFTSLKTWRASFAKVKFFKTLSLVPSSDCLVSDRFAQQPKISRPRPYTDKSIT